MLDRSLLAAFPLSPFQEFTLPQQPLPAFGIALVAGVAQITITGELIYMNRQELKQKVVDLVQAGQREFAIDFARCGYVDSTGLGVLVSLNKRIREADGHLVIQNLNDDLQTLFELTKLDVLFTLERTAAA